MNTDTVRAKSEVLLERVQIGMRASISRHDLMDADVDMLRDHLVQNLSYEMRGFLLGERLQSSAIVSPANWWQHFRQRWFPAVWLKWRPVKKETTLINAVVLYPDLHKKIGIPEERHIVLFNPPTPNRIAK